MTNGLERWRGSLEKGRLVRKKALEDHHALQMQRLELLEKVSATIVSTVAPLVAEVRDTATDPFRIRVFGGRLGLDDIDFCVGDGGDGSDDDFPF
jgi:hypothetical protein